MPEKIKIEKTSHLHLNYFFPSFLCWKVTLVKGVKPYFMVYPKTELNSRQSAI